GHGTLSGEVDDMVLRRGGNTAQLEGSEYAYNLAVVVDDALAGVDQVVRGDDLLSSAPRQAYLAGLLGLPEVEYLHVPLVLGPEGKRLAKRDGAVTMRELGVEDALAWIRESLGGAVAEPESVRDAPAQGEAPAESPAGWAESFRPEPLSREPGADPGWRACGASDGAGGPGLVDDALGGGHRIWGTGGDFRGECAGGLRRVLRNLGGEPQLDGAGAVENLAGHGQALSGIDGQQLLEGEDPRHVRDQAP